MKPAGPSAAAAGSWRLGDLTVNRLGFGAMRLTARAAFGPGHLTENVAAAASRLSVDDLARLAAA